MRLQDWVCLRRAGVKTPFRYVLAMGFGSIADGLVTLAFFGHVHSRFVMQAVTRLTKWRIKERFREEGAS